MAKIQYRHKLQQQYNNPNSPIEYTQVHQTQAITLFINYKHLKIEFGGAHSPTYMAIAPIDDDVPPTCSSRNADYVATRSIVTFRTPSMENLQQTTTHYPPHQVVGTRTF